MLEVYEKAKALHAIGQLGAAEDAYRAVLADDPESVDAHNNLGNVLQDLGRLEEAQASYRRALKISPDNETVLYNLANALYEDRRGEEAIELYRRAIDLNHDSVAAHYNLGTVLRGCGRLQEAEESLRRALDQAPDSEMVNSKLGQVLFDCRRVEEALACFARVIEIDPDSAHAHYEQGRTLEALGRLEEAATSFKKALEIDPQSSAANERLGRVLYLSGRHEAAAEVFRLWQEARPDDPAASHMLAACTGEGVEPRAADDYVSQTFDAFADDFNLIMGRLDYRVPQLLAAAMDRDKRGPRTQLFVLDAGCGTGLCATFLRPYARRLVGVDLSEGMLNLARRLGVYDDLVCLELTAFLADWRESFDLILAGDTLVYFGDLVPVLAAAVRSLRLGGRLLFNLEHLDAPDTAAGFNLTPSGRYGHTEKYVTSVLTETGFTVRSMTTETLRTEGGIGVTGFVVLAAKEAA